MNNDLAQFLALLYSPCGIFLSHALQGIHHLLCLCFIDSLDGTAVLRVGILDEVEPILTILAVEGIASLHVLQFHGTTDITGHHFFHLDTIGTSACKYLGHTFLASTVGIA